MARGRARAAFAIGQLYYYAAAVTGVGFLLGGLIVSLIGLRQAVLPRDFEFARNGFHGALTGLSFAIPGLVTVWWHLREVRQVRSVDAFWGSSLYFHLVALLALGFVLGGVAATMGSLVDLVLPECVNDFFVEAVPAGAELSSDQCHQESADALRRVLDSFIVVLVASPVWWWHLRQGRRLSPSS
ncbi:MAG: hypothetical protein ACRDGU_06185 [Actinomycetota bacterium]